MGGKNYMDEKRKTYSYRLKDDVNKKIEYLTQYLNMKKGDVIEYAVNKILNNIEYQSSLNEFKKEIDEMMNEIKIIRMYHVLDTLKSSDYSNIKNVPSLDIRFDDNGKYGNKGDYVVRVGDLDKLAEYLSKTTNYYDEALKKVVKNEEEKGNEEKKEEKEQ